MCGGTSERVVAKQLNAHLDDNALRDPFQSAYRAGHSTETALIRVKNDIATALDRKCTTILVLLDLSCAFDTINHDILLRGLVASMVLLDSKNVADAIVCACKELLRNLSE